MVITVQCPSCSTVFPVDSAKVPPRGVHARCSVCGGIFRVEKPAEPAPIPVASAVVPPPAPSGPTAGAAPGGAEAPDPPATTEPPPAPEAPAGPSRSETPREARTPPAEPAGEDWTGFVPPAEAPSTAGRGEDDDWAIVRDEEIDPRSVPIEPVGTVEESVAEASRDPRLGVRDEGFEVQRTLEPPLPPLDDPGPSSVGAFTFGRRDPKEKARRLARVLVSDMIMYNPERHARALAGGTLKADFEEEIAKSWKEYVEQVGDQMAEATDFWTEALNDVLAKGRRIF